MRRWKLSANAAFFGAQNDGYTTYQPDRTLEQKFDLVSQIDGLDGIELKYPFDLEAVALAERLLKAHDLELSAVNVDIKDATYFRYGALSARSAQAREKAMERLCTGMDIAAELGANLVTTCPLAEGYQYAFEIDHGAAWQRFIETVKEVATYRDDVRLALEYQPHDMEAKPLLNSVGKMLFVCSEVDKPNMGANLDIGHSFAAQESPAEAATLLARKDRLFYMHSNDNPGDGGDWDMVSGSVHLWEWLELLYTLDRIGYEGWLGADIAAHQLDPVPAFQANTTMLKRMMAFLEQTDLDSIETMIEEEDSQLKVLDYLSAKLLEA
ncbi:MAG: sugar phosphate isomerase/epimerase family protein [Chloroflexota bacterium]|nr:sugar phosphate isomerase/epimerase family protein [Chloroflexota bacterium]